LIESTRAESGAGFLFWQGERNHRVPLGTINCGA
jgi:hypothetical protein